MNKMPNQNKQNKDQIFKMRTTQAEKQMLRKVADKLNAKSVADAIRQMAQKEIKRKPKR